MSRMRAPLVHEQCFVLFRVRGCQGGLEWRTRVSSSSKRTVSSGCEKKKQSDDNTVHILLQLVVCPDGILSGHWRGFGRRITRAMAGNRAGNTWTPLARRTYLGIDCGEQLLHGARRRCAERLIKVDRRRKLLADEVIAPREFAVARERLLNAIGVAAAQRPRRMPRQQGSISCRSFSFMANLARFLSP
jgi:hypothetical protein